MPFAFAGVSAVAGDTVGALLILLSLGALVAPASARRNTRWRLTRMGRNGRNIDDAQDDHSWAIRYRLGASEARQRAATVQGENTRQVLLSLAAGYEELAAELERKSRVDRPANTELPVHSDSGNPESESPESAG